jgi:hypothetical protein
MNQTVINVRGANGTGKSHFVRSQLGPQAEWQVSAKADGPQLRYTVGASRRVAAVGLYHNACGGADGFKDAEHIVYTIGFLLGRGYEQVWFEGMAVSSSYQRYADLDDNLRIAGIDFLWLFLRAPYEVAHARIMQRNGGKPIKEEHLVKKYASVEVTRAKAIRAGRWVYDFTY